jgi:hypothetical protein
VWSWAVGPAADGVVLPHARLLDSYRGISALSELVTWAHGERVGRSRAPGWAAPTPCSWSPGVRALLVVVVWETAMRADAHSGRNSSCAPPSGATLARRRPTRTASGHGRRPGRGARPCRGKAGYHHTPVGHLTDVPSEARSCRWPTAATTSATRATRASALVYPIGLTRAPAVVS